MYWQVLGDVTSGIEGLDTSNATSEPNTPKNRYQDKIPCEEAFKTVTPLLASFLTDNHTPVHLRPSAVQGSDYINASFIDASLELVVLLTLYHIYV